MVEPKPDAPQNFQVGGINKFPFLVLFCWVVDWLFCCLQLQKLKLKYCFSMPWLLTLAASCKIFMSLWLPWVAKRINSPF